MRALSLAGYLYSNNYTIFNEIPIRTLSMGKHGWDRNVWPDVTIQCRNSLLLKYGGKSI